MYDTQKDLLDAFRVAPEVFSGLLDGVAQVAGGARQWQAFAGVVSARVAGAAKACAGLAAAAGAAGIAGGQASDAAHQYQARFVTHLKQRFPKAQIRLTTAGWEGETATVS